MKTVAPTNPVCESIRRIGGLALALLLMLATIGCSPVTSLNVPLNYTPTRPFMAAEAMAIGQATRIFVQPVVDAREDKSTIGICRDKNPPVPILQGTLSPPDFLQQVVMRELRDAGLRMVAEKAQADRVISISLTRFYTIETNRYKGDIRGAVKVTDAAGKVLFDGFGQGYGDRFGRTLKGENYDEAFSDAAATFLESLCRQPAFIAAMKTGS